MSSLIGIATGLLNGLNPESMLRAGQEQARPVCLCNGLLLKLTLALKSSLRPFETLLKHSSNLSGHTTPAHPHMLPMVPTTCRSPRHAAGDAVGGRFLHRAIAVEQPLRAPRRVLSVRLRCAPVCREVSESSTAAGFFGNAPEGLEHVILRLVHFFRIKAYENSERL